MQGLGKGFFVSALVYGVLGMLLGLHMAISNNHGQMPTHAHIMVIGWVSFAIFGLFYAMFENFVPQALARIHFWLAQVSLAALVVGLLLVYSGRPQFEPIAAVSSIGYALSFLLFAYVALSAMRAQSA
jgi:heme/copper-type cytochrome/quinol oxidase subunit 1